MNGLRQWLTDQEVSNAEFGRRIGRTAEAVRRYAEGERIPDRETMPKIVRETAGKVDANAFFDIPAQVCAECAEAPSI